MLLCMLCRQTAFLLPVAIIGAIPTSELSAKTYGLADLTPLQKECIKKEVEIFRQDGTLITFINAKERLELKDPFDIYFWQGHDKSRSRAVFSSNDQRLIALHLFLQELGDQAPEGMSIWLYKTDRRSAKKDEQSHELYTQLLGYLDEIRVQKQTKIVAMAVQWIKDGKLGQQNQGGPFKELANYFNITPNAVTGTAGYAPGGKSWLKRMFNSSGEFYAALRAGVAAAISNEYDLEMLQRLSEFNFINYFQTTDDDLDKDPLLTSLYMSEVQREKQIMLQWGLNFYLSHQRFPLMRESSSKFARRRFNHPRWFKQHADFVAQLEQLIASNNHTQAAPCLAMRQNQ